MRARAWRQAYIYVQANFLISYSNICFKMYLTSLPPCRPKLFASLSFSHALIHTQAQIFDFSFSIMQAYIFRYMADTGPQVDNATCLCIALFSISSHRCVYINTSTDRQHNCTFVYTCTRRLYIHIRALSRTQPSRV